MIIVHGTIPVLPEHLDEALRLARTMTEETHKEPGCISYDFYVGLTDPNTLMLFQEWEDMDSLMAHFQTPHMEVFLSQLPELTPPIDSVLYGHAATWRAPNPNRRRGRQACPRARFRAAASA